MFRGISHTSANSFTRAENLGVLHVIKGQKSREDGMLGVHISLAFVHGIRMPYFPYELITVHESSLQKIQEFGHLIALDVNAAHGRSYSRMEGQIASANAKVKHLVDRHDARYPNVSQGLSILDLIREKGREVVELLEFEVMFDILLDLSKARIISQLHIVTNIENVPWDWMYQKDKFLSDLFGIGLSSRQTDFSHAKRELVGDIQRLNVGRSSKNKSVLHFFCRYQKNQFSQLKDFARIESLDRELHRILRPVFGDRIFGIEVEKVTQITEALQQYAGEVELVIFSGHYEEEGFVYEGRYTKRHFSSAHVPEITLKQRPIIIFGGCASESSGLGASHASTLSPFVKRKTEYRETLPERFFQSGASACVVTSAALKYEHYEEILPLLVSQLAMSNKVSIGNAVSSIRNGIQENKGRRSRSNNDALLVALYQLHVLGDPTATIW